MKTRSALLVLCTLASISWTASAQQQTIEMPGVIVQLSGVPAEYGQAFATIMSEARVEYEETLGLSLPDTLIFEVKYDPDGELRLFTDGDSRFFLTVTQDRHIAPPTQGGPHNVYGICHEMGHIVMYRQLRSLVGLPAGIGEGWAHYAGSVVVDEVAQRLGDAIYPVPYDVCKIEGMGRLQNQVQGVNWRDLEGSARATRIFYDIEMKHGRDVVGQVMKLALKRSEIGKDLMPAFVEALREVTEDPEEGAWIPEDMLVATVRWDAPRQLPDGFFGDLGSWEDDTGVALYYGDGTEEGKKSTAGSGQTIAFQCPEGEWQLDRIAIAGSRYGYPQVPDETFSVYILDGDFELLQESMHPLGMFERGDPQWYEIALEPVAVPEVFYVCVDFAPTATKGVYVLFDASVQHSHSRNALPYTFISEVDGRYDWMIRAHVAPSEE